MKSKVKNTSDQILNHWRKNELAAQRLRHIVADLRFGKSVDLVLFRRDIYETSPSQLIHLHGEANNYMNEILEIDLTKSIAQIISKISKLAPCRVDIGRMGVNWFQDPGDASTLEEFVNRELTHTIDSVPKNKPPKDVVLYGFGRIGRLVARRIIESTGKGEQLRLKAIVIRPKLKDKYQEANKRASLLASDSVHGDFGGQIKIARDGESLTVNGNKIYLIYAAKPDDIDYLSIGINDALVIDNTGVWRDESELSVHLRPGISQVLLTAPGQGKVPNIVYGVNHLNFDFTKNKIISAASCTTNAIVPVLSVLQAKYGVEKGHVETIHSYTNDQNLLDNFHKKPRRGRGAPINMVLTSTGAAKAVSKVIPNLSGKLTGNAVRVPTPNVSIAILNLTLQNPTNLTELNDTLQNAALHGDLVEQIHFSRSNEYVSSNAIGMTTTSVVDAPSTIVSDDGKTAIVYLWYDNEYGYTCQVVRLAKKAAGVNRYVYY